MTQSTATYDDFDKPDEVQTSSDRSFGLVFAVGFFIVGIIPMLQGGSFRWWAAMGGALFATVASSTSFRSLVFFKAS